MRDVAGLIFVCAIMGVLYRLGVRGTIPMEIPIGATVFLALFFVAAALMKGRKKEVKCSYIDDMLKEEGLENWKDR